MTRRIDSALLALLALVCLAVAAPSWASSSAPVPRDMRGAIARSVLANVQQQEPVTCSGGAISITNATTAGYQHRFRFVAYCPRGAVYVRFMFAGQYSAPAPNRLIDPQPMNLALERAPTPAPWDSTRTYAAGEQATYFAANTGTGANNPTWQAVNTNVGSPPQVGNANWTNAASPALVPITCGGDPECGLTTVTTAGGTTVSQGYYITDPVFVNCASACYVALRGWVVQSGTMRLGTNQSGKPYLGQTGSNGTTVTDPTLSATTYQLMTTSRDFGITPLAVLGRPATDGHSVCIIGDSIAAGINGGAANYSITSISGGSGYSIGDIVSPNNAGASAGGVGRSARYIVNNVSGGVVTSLGLVDPGDYTDPGQNTSQTYPSGTQTFTSVQGSGTGLTATLSFATGSIEMGDKYGGQGWVQRGLNNAGIPWTSFASSGDRAVYWASTFGDLGRSVLAGRTGCTLAIIELGINDDTSGRSAAQMQADVTTIANSLIGQGISKVYLSTLLPYPTSTDGYLTLANQTVPGTDSVRQTYNTWVRTRPAPFSGYLDPALIAEDVSNPGKLKVDGVTVCKWLCDSKHPTSGGAQLLAPAVTSPPQPISANDKYPGGHSMVFAA